MHHDASSLGTCNQNKTNLVHKSTLSILWVKIKWGSTELVITLVNDIDF